MAAEVKSPRSWPECMARLIACREIRGGLLLEDLGAELYLRGWKELVEQSRQKRKLVSGRETDTHSVRRLALLFGNE